MNFLFIQSPPFLRYVVRIAFLVEPNSFAGIMSFVANLEGNGDLFLLEDCNGQ